MPKMKIEIQKPQYLAAKEPVSKVDEEAGEKKTPFFFRLLVVATYMLSGMAIWYVYQKYSAHS
ncbi:MAG: hypothetical protein V1882_07180 [Candidatus Omnitrophota bacterium]